MAEESQPITQTRRRARPETSAWLMMLAFFFIFCAIVAGGGIFGWRAYTNAMEKVDGSVVRVHRRAGVTYQARGSAKKVTPDVPCKDNPAAVTDVCVSLDEGDHVQAVPDAGYGQVASIKLRDQTQVDMWAHPTGADITLKTYQVSRWSHQRQAVVFSQTAGYARYDVPSKDSQPYGDVSYTVQISRGVSLALAPGGSYSVNVPHADKDHPPALTDSGQPLLIEVAVRAGSVEVQTDSGSVTARPGEKIQIDVAGAAGAPLPARWELIRDGTFEQWATQGNADGPSAWTENFILMDVNATAQEQNGQFGIQHRCGPVAPNKCTAAEYAYIGQFSRYGHQHRSYAKMIEQSLDLDVSEYRSLLLSTWVRIVDQSVPKAGEQGSECPMTIHLIYKQNSPSDQQQNRYFCIYIDETEADLPQDQKGSEFIYTPVHQKQWINLKYELRNYDSVKDSYYLQTIQIYANGHDYVSEITNISLIASQQQ